MPVKMRKIYKYVAENSRISEKKQKNMGSFRSPCTRFGRNASIYDLHEWQVGCRFLPLLLPTSTYRQSVGGRPANRQKN